MILNKVSTDCAIFFNTKSIRICWCSKASRLRDFKARKIEAIEKCAAHTYCRLISLPSIRFGSTCSTDKFTIMAIAWSRWIRCIAKSNDNKSQCKSNCNVIASIATAKIAWRYTGNGKLANIRIYCWRFARHRRHGAGPMSLRNAVGDVRRGIILWQRWPVAQATLLLSICARR